ncbi:SH3 domain-containing protein [Chitinophaga deserti]|uniref:SH3 domain-containing protein n=1 Tax=Chitinophaga deserti TaxID=2164099 RepID=UPI000D6B77A9|nr:SH3 domain-containing protein [Chitinophaga deserti]
MRVVLIPFLLIAATSVNAQTHQWAVIEDADHFTNIRQAPSANAPVVDSIGENQFFVVEKKRGDWWKVLNQSITPDGSGYIHKSRVRLINQLPDTAAQRLLRKVFGGYQRLVSLRNDINERRENTPDKFTAEDNALLLKTSQSISDTYDNSYEPALRFLPKYLCRTNDDRILQDLFRIMVADTGSASETPGDALGECYICQPEWFLKQLRTLPSEERNIIFKQTQFGLENNMEVAADKRAALSEMLNVEMVRKQSQ